MKLYALKQIGVNNRFYERGGYHTSHVGLVSSCLFDLKTIKGNLTRLKQRRFENRKFDIVEFELDENNFNIVEKI